MAHHAYFAEGDLEKGIIAAHAFAKAELSLAGDSNPDLITLRYGLFSVEDSRRVGELTRSGSVGGGAKMLIIATGRIFHEAQNALLKVFEEPPEGTTLVLIVPSAGDILPTLRSRLLPLPASRESAPHGSRKGTMIYHSVLAPLATEFLEGTKAVREKLVAKLLDRAKSDKDSEKQEARLDALQLAEGLARAAYAARVGGEGNEKALVALLADLDIFIPVLHDRSAPLKPIFEHLLLVIPPGLGRG